jgi:uncharacterized protein (TIGR00255 family)
MKNMIRSMTAFARVEQQEKWGQLCWEVRSVNHRFLDISVRLPDDFRALEELIRKRIQNQFNRGKVECVLYFKPIKNADNLLNINLNVVQQIWNAYHSINTVIGNIPPPTATDILHWQGVLESETLNIEEVSDILLHHLELALTQLRLHREREGVQLLGFIEQRSSAIAVEIQKIRAILPNILNAMRERLNNRLAELTEINSERLEQEVVLFAQKMDVAEELDRVDAHLKEIQQTLLQTEPVGRRMDFLVQELNREANTIGSKSVSVDTSHSAVELKVLIEQMREQIQNIE